MHTNDFLRLLPFAALAFVIGSVALRRRMETQFSYKPCDILTPNETEFFGRLRAALPDHYVFPQVAMSAIIAPWGYARNKRAAYNRIAQKRVDFAIFTDRLQLVVLVELDDRSHDVKRDAIRDAMTLSAGIRTLRFSSSKRPTVAELRAAILPVSDTARLGSSFTAFD